jgi:hypothetical protein
MTILSLLAMGVSALARNELSTGALWYGWWVLGAVFALFVERSQPWLCHLSFTYNICQLELSIFRVDHSLKTAQENIPVLGELLKMGPATQKAYEFPAIGGALVVLGLLLALTTVLLHRRIKPE